MAALDRYDEWRSDLDALLASSGRVGPGPEDPLSDVYDVDTLAAIDVGTAGRGGTVRWRGRAAAGVVAAGLVAGMREVFEPDDGAVVEEHDVRAARLEAVTVHLAWGEPGASVAIVRRWLL